MPTFDTSDHTISFNIAGTWVELSRLAEEFGIEVDEIEDALGEMNLDWIGEDLTDRAEALLREELVDVFGDPSPW